MYTCMLMEGKRDSMFFGEKTFYGVLKYVATHTPVPLPGESHEWRSLVGYSPWGRKESDTTERLHFHFHFLSIMV